MSRVALRSLVVAAVATAVAATTGCSSPEARRVRGGGPAADVGNKSAVVQMHEGSRPFYKTPMRIGSAGLGSLEPASQADRLSRGEGSASPRLEGRPGHP
jgi:hypothetical protein